MFFSIHLRDMKMDDEHAPKHIVNIFIRFAVFILHRFEQAAAFLFSLSLLASRHS